MGDTKDSLTCPKHVSGNPNVGVDNSGVVARLLKEMDPDSKKSLQGWYWFDWANQAFALTVITVVAVSYTHLTLPTILLV